MTIVTLVGGCGNAYPGGCTGDRAGEGDGRAARHRLVADAMVGVIANPMSGRDIRQLVTSASVFPNAEKASMVVRLTAAAGALAVGRVLVSTDTLRGTDQRDDVGCVDGPPPGLC